MTNQLYTRQESLGIDRDQSIMVVGCGGIGSWVGYFLGLAGVKELHLYDGDDISVHNLNRLPFTPGDIGTPKSLALANLIKAARPDSEVLAYGAFDPEWHAERLKECNRVVVSTDTLRSRRMVYNAIAGPSKDKYIELGADGHGLTVTGAPAEWSTKAEDEPGYQSVPVFVGPCTLAASIASYYILLRKPLTDTFRVDWDDARGLSINTYCNV
jgi:ThiF family